MKKKKILLATILISIALLGVILTQLFWVTKAIRTRSELLDQTLNVGIKRIVNQIMLLQSNIDHHPLSESGADEPISAHRQFIHQLDPEIINDMVYTEFGSIFPNTMLYYAIFDIESKEFVICNCQGLDESILASPHQAPISCIFQKDQFMFSVLFPDQKRFIVHQLQLNIISSAIFTLIIILGFWYIVNMLLQEKKLSEMKHDFVNNMTHELKTPIATISVASEMLLNKSVAANTEKVIQYSGIIRDENDRLRNKVDHVLTVARLEKNDFKLEFAEINAHDIILSIVGKFEMQIAKKEGTIHTRLNAANAMVWADAKHFANIIENLIDNAIKYSKDFPEITISTHCNNIGLKIIVEDKGIGIDQKNLDKIFLQFHRISTGDIHNVKGFGIGLYYVKKILEAHEGTMQVTSTLGKGSVFTIFLPFKEVNKTKENERRR